MKICSQCKTKHPLIEFGSDKRASDKKRSECKKCRASYFQKNKIEINNRRKEKYDPEKIKDYLNRPEVKENQRIWRQKYRKKNPEKVRKWGRDDYQRHSAKRKDTNKAWGKANKTKKISYEAGRRASKLNRTPNWLTPEDHAQISDYYKVAKMLTEVTGTKYHVDHEIAMQAEDVCGLHVPQNLQVITGVENCSKHNRVDLQELTKQDNIARGLKYG